jgi:hypothetical protein
MSTKDHTQGKRIFDKHYFGITNPITPIAVEYGVLGDTKPGDPVLAYEISRNEDSTRFGLTVVREDPDGETYEQRSMRATGSTLDEIRQEIAEIVLRFNPL